MTQDCSQPSSTATVHVARKSDLLPSGTPITESTASSASGKEELSISEPSSPTTQSLPWGYIHVPHVSVHLVEQRLQSDAIIGHYHPRSFIHRSLRYKQKPSGHGVKKELVPSISGLIFLQGTTEQLRLFLRDNFPQYHLINNCSTHEPASIPDRVMQPFMTVMSQAPERITFLRDPFIKFAKDRVRLRIVSGPFAGQEGYVVRIHRDRQLVMDLAGYAVAISNVHTEDFQVVEEK